MLKLNNKNKVSKISNIILIVMFVISLLSCISVFPDLIKGEVVVQDGYKLCDYWASAYFTLLYAAITGTLIILLNKKIDLYKDEYTKSRQVFNLFIMVSFMVTLLSLSSWIINLLVCNKFSMYELVNILLSYALVYICSYVYVSRSNLLVKENDKKTNITNFIIIYFIMNYSSLFIMYLLNILFEISDIIESLRGLVFSLLWLVIILLSYKLLNRKTK